MEELKPGEKVSKAEIGYATPLARLRQRRFARAMVFAGCLVAVVTGVWMWQTSVGPQFRLWRERRAARALWERCMRVTSPANEVAYEEDLARAGELLKDPGKYVALNWAGAPPTLRAAARRWPVEEKAIFDINRYWHAPGQDLATLFFHERRNPRLGEDMLLIVELDSTTAGVKESKNVWSFTYTEFVMIGSGDMGWRQQHFELLVPIKLNDTAANKLRFFAGQADAADETHFTIRYEVNGESGELDGRLTEWSGVTLKARTGPAVVEGNENQ